MAALIGANVLGVQRLMVYALLGGVLRLEFLSSGVHATVAGVLLALAIPSGARLEAPTLEDRLRQLTAGPKGADAHASGLVTPWRLTGRQPKMISNRPNSSLTYARARPTSVGHIQGTSALRPGQCGRVTERQQPTRLTPTPGRAGRAGRALPREAARDHSRHLDRCSLGHRTATRWHQLAPHLRSSLAGGHRFHDVDLHREAGLCRRHC